MPKITIAMMSMIILSGCAITFQNISTHGTAEDLVDETQAPEVQAEGTVQVPAL